MHSRQLIGQFLVDAGRIDRAQLGSALALQRERGGRLGEALVALGFVSEPVLMLELARKHDVPYAEIGERSVPREVLQLVPEKLIRRWRILPLGFGHGRGHTAIVVATTEPQNLAMLDEIAFATGMTAKPVLVGDRDLDRAIRRNLSPGAGANLN